MPLWRGTDVANSAPIFAPAYFKKAPTRANANLLYGNTTANNLIAGITVATQAINSAEMRAYRAGKIARPAHQGWVTKKTGQGGRANRIQYEVLVAGGIATDAVIEDGNYALVFTAQPANSTVSASNTTANQGFFTVSAASVPTGATLSYYWQRWNGSAFANVTANATYANVTGTTLVVSANTLATNTDILRCIVASANAVIANNVASVNAYLTKIA